LGTKDIQWTTTDGNFTTATNITNPTVDAGGTYVVTITNTSNTCYTVRGVTVDQNITPPTIQINNPLDLTCSRTEVSITSLGTSVDASALTYLWSAGAGGNIVSGGNTSITGTELSSVTSTKSEAVQPVVVCSAVTVYLPAASTVG